MKAIIIDTTMNELFIMLVEDGACVYKTNCNSRFHNAVIMTMIDELLSERKLNIADLDYVGCVVGPGSFTGIRIGVSICNGLSYGAGLKKIEINSLALVHSQSVGQYINAIKARESNYYYALFDGENLIKCGDSEIKDLYEICPTVFMRGEENQIVVENYYKALSRKISDKETVDYFTPNYMKLSQAERLKKQG